MDPEIHRIYDASTAVAGKFTKYSNQFIVCLFKLIPIVAIVVKGNSHNLLKKGAKRRRTAAEIEEAKLEEER